ncbi:MAG: histidine phosphatase family protein [Bdellovibrionales bacterium]|jgi:phosphohistidine phosphatase|nr:histidine phosphatase family protein [Bdellovibrionales bacterium]
MKTLYLLRHAEAEGGAGPADSDHARVLSAKGRAEGRDVGRFMKEKNMMPEFILASDALRTMSTARLVAEELFGDRKAPITSRFDRSLYLAPADSLLAHVQAVTGKLDRLLLVAHNPGILEFAMHLGRADILDFEGFPPATLAVFESSAEDWALITPDNTHLAAQFTPHL